MYHSPEFIHMTVLAALHRHLSLGLDKKRVTPAVSGANAPVLPASFLRTWRGILNIWIGNSSCSPDRSSKNSHSFVDSRRLPIPSHHPNNIPDGS